MAFGLWITDRGSRVFLNLLAGRPFLFFSPRKGSSSLYLDSTKQPSLEAWAHVWCFELQRTEVNYTLSRIWSRDRGHRAIMRRAKIVKLIGAAKTGTGVKNLKTIPTRFDRRNASAQITRWLVWRYHNWTAEEFMTSFDTGCNWAPHFNAQTDEWVSS